MDAPDSAAGQQCGPLCAPQLHGRDMRCAATTTCMRCAVPEDEAVVALLADKFEEVLEFSSSVVGALPEPGLPADRPDIRTKEMAIANTVCDSMIAALKDTVPPKRPHRCP